MSFMDDNDLPDNKTTLRPRPSTADPRQWLKALEWNSVMAALKAVRLAIVAAVTFAFTPQTSRPSAYSGGQPYRLWVRDSDKKLLYFNGTVDRELGSDRRVFFANDYAGADIGAQIHAASAALIGTKADICVLPGNYTISTQATLNPYHRLLLPIGKFDNDITFGPIFRMKDHTAIVGSGYGTEIVEPHTSSYDGVPVIEDYNTGASGSTAAGNDDLLVCDLQISIAASVVSGNQGALQFGNVSNVRVTRCYFNATSGFAVAFGGAPDDGNYAHDVEVTDCLAQNVSSQVFAVVNAYNFKINDNKMYACGQRESVSTHIDAELNVPLGLGANFQICRNLVDARGATAVAGFAIQVLGQVGPPSLADARNGVITDNVVIGGDAANGSDLVGGIVLNACQSVLIANNSLNWLTNEPVSLIYCSNCTVANNHLTNCAAAYTDSIKLIDSNNCTVRGNTIVADQQGGLGAFQASISEADLSTYPLKQNLIYGNHLFFNPRIVNTDLESSILTSDYEPHIKLVASDSRQYGNFINGIPCDGTTIRDVADLRTLVPPIMGTTYVLTVETSGSGSAGDGDAAIFKWNDTSTATDNGVTVIKPNVDHSRTGGRWIREPDAPKMTTTARDALSLGSADASYRIWNTTAVEFQFWNGSSWQSFGGGGGVANPLTSDLDTGGHRLVDSASVQLRSSAADGASAVASVVDTATAWSTDGAKLQSWCTNGTEVARLRRFAGSSYPVLEANGTSIALFNSNGSVDGVQVGNTLVNIFAQGSNRVTVVSNALQLGGGVDITPSDLSSKAGGSGARFTEAWARVHAGVHHDVTSGGAVSIDTQLGEMCVLTSNANVTGITLAAGKAAQLFTLGMIEGSSGYTWPTTITNARLAGGSFTKSSASGAVDTITFRYNATNSTWDEISRSLALA